MFANELFEILYYSQRALFIFDVSDFIDPMAPLMSIMQNLPLRTVLG